MQAMNHVYEHAGVLLGVQYEKSEGMTTFISVRALGSDYLPIGPELKHFLDESLILIRLDEEGGTSEAATFLSAIAEELP